MPDTKETREKKGRVKERQRLEADIEEALEVVDATAEPSHPDDDEDIELSFEE